MMKKRLGAVLLILTMLSALAAGALPALAEEGSITLRIHYFREDGQYEDRKLWIWDNASVPCTNFDSPYEFEEIDGEMICQVKVNSGTAEIGYSIHMDLSDYCCMELPDYPPIDIAQIVAGTVDVYVRAGTEEHEIVLGEDVQTGWMILMASYKEKNSEGNPQVAVRLSDELDGEPTPDTFTVSNSEGAVSIDAVKNVNVYYYLTLSEPLDLQRSYVVTCEDKECAVIMPDAGNGPEKETEPATTLSETVEASAPAETTAPTTQQETSVTAATPLTPAQRPEPDERKLPWILLITFGTAFLGTAAVLILKKKK